MGKTTKTSPCERTCFSRYPSPKMSRIGSLSMKLSPNNDRTVIKLQYLVIYVKNNGFWENLKMLTWKRPQKHHHVKEHKIPVILRYRMPKSVHGAWRNLKSCILHKKEFVRWPPFKWGGADAQIGILWNFGKWWVPGGILIFSDNLSIQDSSDLNQYLFKKTKFFKIGQR